MEAETRTMSTWLFIYGLTDSITADELTERVASCGTVCSAELLPKAGQAHVEMATHHEAQIVAEVLNGTQLRGETIHVLLVDSGERLNSAKTNVDWGFLGF